MRILLSLICLAALLCGLLAGCGEGPQPTGPVAGDLDAKIAADISRISNIEPK